MQTHAYIYEYIYIYMYVYIHAYRMHGVLDGIDFVFLNIWGDLQTPEPSGAASVMSTWHHNMNCSSQSSCHSNILKLTETIGLKGGIALVISSFPSNYTNKIENEHHLGVLNIFEATHISFCRAKNWGQFCWEDGPIQPARATRAIGVERLQTLGRIRITPIGESSSNLQVAHT